MEKKKTIVYSRDTVEFVTVAAEFCGYVEGSQGRNRKDFVNTILKLLPLLYLKASLLQTVEVEEDFYPETFVTEQDYEYLRMTIAAVMGEHDDYLDLCNDDVRFSDEPMMKSISEDIADVYQAVRNFVETYRIGVEENMLGAVAEIEQSFNLYWGQTLVNAMRALHKCKGMQEEDDDDLYNDAE